MTEICTVWVVARCHNPLGLSAQDWIENEFCEIFDCEDAESITADRLDGSIVVQFSYDVEAEITKIWGDHFTPDEYEWGIPFKTFTNDKIISIKQS